MSSLLQRCLFASALLHAAAVLAWLRFAPEAPKVGSVQLPETVIRWVEVEADPVAPTPEIAEAMPAEAPEPEPPMQVAQPLPEPPPAEPVRIEEIPPTPKEWAYAVAVAAPPVADVATDAVRPLLPEDPQTMREDAPEPRAPVQAPFDELPTLAVEAQQTTAADAEQYWSRVVQAVTARLRYPAALRGAGGHVQVRVEVNRDGSLGAVEVLEVEGHPLLESAVLEAVRAAAPFPRRPGGTAGVAVVPVRFEP